MSNIVYVSIQGPWWTKLAYKSEEALDIGTRVVVPLGKSERIGFITTPDSNDIVKNSENIEIKSIIRILDKKPVIPWDIAETIEWFSSVWFTSKGLAAKIMLPPQFFSDESIPYVPYRKSRSGFSVNYVYNVYDVQRYDKYIDIINNAQSTVLLLFSENTKAEQFWAYLSEELKKQGLMWKSTHTKKQWKMWLSLREESPNFIVGTQVAAFLPINELGVIVLDEESSGAWVTQKRPVFHWRSVICMRAKFADCKLVLGGKMPSSKSYLQLCSKNLINDKQKCNERLTFVDLHNSSLFDVDAIKNPLPISKPLMRETYRSNESNKWALWVFDRKGYAGGIYCEDCGTAVTCPVCGGNMKWKSRKQELVCVNCSRKCPVPEHCPECGGVFLEGTKPGLEALQVKATGYRGNWYKNVVLIENDGEKIPSAKELTEKYPNGALIVGTRKILALSDYLDIGVIGWIDADAAAFSSGYDAKYNGFRLIFESIWRGKNPDERKIVIQSRRPSKSWQSSLATGWSWFWKEELRERELWGLPPFMPMIKIKVPGVFVKNFVEILENDDFDFWQSEEHRSEIWIRTKKFTKLATILRPYFNINNTRKGFPQITLYTD